jgi:hypothetical protein
MDTILAAATTTTAIIEILLIIKSASLVGLVAVAGPTSPMAIYAATLAE